jgi:hypothetical protein
MSPVHIIVEIIVGIALLQKVLKKSAYPDSVPNRLKWIHAIILFLVNTAALDAFIEFAYWICSYLRFGSSQILAHFDSHSGEAATALMLMAELVTGLSAMFLSNICKRMMERQEYILKWYFIIYPIYFMSSTFLGIMCNRMIIPMQTIVIAEVLSTILFLFTIIFYLRSSVRKAIFGSKE